MVVLKSLLLIAFERIATLKAVHAAAIALDFTQAAIMKRLRLLEAYLKLHFQSEDHANLIELIRQAKVDLAVVSPNVVPYEMDGELLKPDRYLMVGSAKWQCRPLSESLERERIIDCYESDKATFNYLQNYDLAESKRPNRLFVKRSRCTDSNSTDSYYAIPLYNLQRNQQLNVAS